MWFLKEGEVQGRNVKWRSASSTWHLHDDDDEKSEDGNDVGNKNTYRI